MRFWVLLFLCLSRGLNGLASVAPKAKPELVLTAVEDSNVPQSQFSCHGKIHGYLRLPTRQSNSHLLESRWILPTGKVVADTSNAIDFHPERSTAYLWFYFPETPLLGSIDPDLDQERLAYNGTWHVEVLWDHLLLLSQKFDVHCPY